MYLVEASATQSLVHGAGLINEVLVTGMQQNKYRHWEKTCRSIYRKLESTSVESNNKNIKTYILYAFVLFYSLGYLYGYLKM